jgi:hypothetical protein
LQQGEFNMKQLISAVLFVSAFAVPGLAFADAGGVPNENATIGGPGSNAPGNGRKANCVPPGSVFSQFAKQPGPNNNPADLGTPGQIVNDECHPS